MTRPVEGRPVLSGQTRIVLRTVLLLCAIAGLILWGVVALGAIHDPHWVAAGPFGLACLAAALLTL